MQRRVIIAIGLTLLAVGTAVVALRDSLPQNAVAWMALSAALAVGAFIAAAPWFVAPVLAVLGLPLRTPTARLALANSRRNPRRVTATTTALTIGIALIGLITVLTTSAGLRPQTRRSTARSDPTCPSGRRRCTGRSTMRSPNEPPPFRDRRGTFIRTTAGQRQEIPVPVFVWTPWRSPAP